MPKWVRFAFVLLACLSLRLLPATSQQPGAASPTADLAALASSGIADLPEGFSEKVVATGITGATALAVAPDGRVFVCEQTGTLRVVKDDKLLDKPFLTVVVDSSWERGLIGVTLDQDFPKQPHVYVVYVAPKPYPHHVVSRFTAKGDAAEPNSEVVLLEGDDQSKLGGSVPNGHQGGALHFGKDGKLYIAIGEQTAGLPAQKLDTFQGKLLRINPDGSIPADNPFFNSATGKYRAIWALGLRNPYTFAVQPGTGRIFINDVGEARWEEIDEGIGGANYGWPHAEGFGANPKFQNPVHAYDHALGRSIAGAAFYNPSVQQFPKEYSGKYFFADFMDNWIRILDPARLNDVKLFASGLVGPVDLQVSADGSLYYLNRNAWVKDEKFKPNTGSLHRVSYTANSGKPAPVFSAQPEEMTAAVGRRATFSVQAKGEEPLRYQWLRNGRPVNGANDSTFAINVAQADDGAEFRCLVSNVHGAVKSRPAALWTTPLPKPLDGIRVGLNPQDLPRLLSETGVFRSVRDLTPATGVLPYEVNAPLWSDGAAKKRWMALPQDTRIGFSEHGAWKFPPGTVFVKHFDMPSGEGQVSQKLETRLLVVDRRGTGYGVTYKWRADGSDAELLTDGLTEEIDRGGWKQTWSYPSRNDCLVCHTPSAGFVLGVNTRQLNHSQADPISKMTDNLLRTWNRFALFQPAIRDEVIPRLDQLAYVVDSSATLEHRARSYLDANCAQCHRPGGARADFDARFETPLAKQKLINTPLVSSDLGVPGVKLVVPGNPDRSMIYLRMKRRQDSFNMPPLATHEIDPAALGVVREWIMRLGSDGRTSPPGPLSERERGRKTTSPPGPLSDAERGRKTTSPRPSPTRRGGGRQPHPPAPSPTRRGGGRQPHPPAPSPTRRWGGRQPHPPAPSPTRRGGATPRGAKRRPGADLKRSPPFFRKTLTRNRSPARSPSCFSAASRSTPPQSG